MATNAQRRRGRRDAVRSVHRHPARLGRATVVHGSHEPPSWSCRCRGCYCGTQLATVAVCRACRRGDHRRRVAGRHDVVKEQLRVAMKKAAA